MSNTANDLGPPLIKNEIDLFTSHLESLKQALPLTMCLLQGVGKEVTGDFKVFQSRTCSVSEEDGGTVLNIPPEHYREWKRKLAPVKNIGMAKTLMPRSLLVTMVSQYDAFLGRLLRALFISRPETFKNSDKAFSFEEISSFGSLEAFKGYVIEKEVESVLRKSHSDQFKYLEQKFGLPLKKNLEIWPVFIEVTQRRNLFVHADGFVSSQYLAICREHRCTLEDDATEGAKLTVSPEYFKQAYYCLYEIGVKLAHVLWRKVLPGERIEADKSFNSSAFDLIEKEEYDLACNLMDFAATAFAKHLKGYDRSVFTINRAQAHKWANRTEKCREILEGADWSAQADEFKLAYAVLTEDWAQSAHLMKRMGSNHYLVTKVQYRDWPLFKEFRRQKEFLNTYIEVFGEQFEVNISGENIDSDDSSGTELSAALELLAS